LRDAYPALREQGAEVVVVGTGDLGHARDFARADRIPFPVLVDDGARAARAASIRRVPFLALFRPASWAATRRAWRAGYRIGKPGPRTNQLGATFVVGPGDRLRYEHRDAHTADHAPLAEVMDALAVEESR
jgi:peroxiredoxin